MKNVYPENLSSVISVLRESGCRIRVNGKTVHVVGPARPGRRYRQNASVSGIPDGYAGTAHGDADHRQGTSIVVETVFENRYKHFDELLRMGANIKLEGRIAVIKGVRKLVGANVTARDLRGGAALVLAGLAAEGETVVSGIRHIDRGYERIEEKLRQIGATIRRVD